MSSSAEKYDVFLSFRGEDTRKDFTTHLFEALKKKLIKTYMDCLLDRGEDVWPALSKAIDNSQVSIIVFSDSYATSKWCLEELVRILERRKDQGQVVIPVFYETDPSDIRYQKGTYGKAFNKYEGEIGNNESNRQRVENWRAALTEAANISGWDSRNYMLPQRLAGHGFCVLRKTYIWFIRDDVKLIDNVVKDVSEKRNLRRSIELKGLVGTDEICRTVELYMNNKVRVIGIWGMAGIGKTTIARVLFARHFPKFDNVCFVANVREYSLDRLLSELLKEVVTGMTFDMSRLKSKKVFIVLDNVSSLDQLLEDLCNEFRGQNGDSRLIITTRNKQLLEGRVDLIHNVKKWNDPESQRLFRLEAFKENPVPKDFEKLVEKVVDYAGGVPLALKVLGSYLYTKQIPFWKATLKKLEKYSNKEIQKRLKVSYDGLDDLEKKIFLDIAFFFNGENKDHVISILDACGFEAGNGIEALADLALINVSYSNIIEMHDLLQVMAFDIVRQECSSNPARRSRLRDIEEVRAILKENKGTDAIEGITVDLSQIEDLRLSADTFKKMKNLRYLKVYSSLGQSSGNLYLPRALKPFSNKLRYLEWSGYPLESLPQTFCATLLVEIRMPHSHLKQLWNGKQKLDKLEAIDLSESKQLKELPDLSLAPRLKWVNLSGCVSLCDLHHSLLSSDTLVTLILDGCTNVSSVKSTKHLKSLKNISVDGCSSLREFAVSSDLIENLDLSKTRVETLDTSIGLLQNLRWLNLEGLGLKLLLKELSRLTSLTALKLSHSGLVIDKDQLHALFEGLKSLQILYLMGCSNLFELPDNIGGLSKLYELRLDGSSVKRLPTSIKNLQELEILSLRNCQELQNIPELPPLIKELNAHNCGSLVSVSNSKTFAAKMMGKTKRISFENNLKLDDQSIMRSLHLTMVSASFHNLLVRRYNDDVHSFNYNSVEVCLPGSHVLRLREFEYRTSNSSSVAIQFPTSSIFLGFIYYVVLTPSHEIKSHVAKIYCECHLAGGTISTWQDKEIGELKSDHVYMWYDPFNCDFIRIYNETEASLKFSVRTGAEEVDGSIGIKECGAHLISVSELNIVLLELEMDSDKRKDLEEEFEVDIGHSDVPIPPSSPPKEINIEGSYDQKQIDDGMRNMTLNQRDLSEQFSYDLKVASSSKDTHKDGMSDPWQIIDMDSSSSHEPASHFPTIPPSAEAEKQTPNHSSKQEKDSETAHVEGVESPSEAYHSREAQINSKLEDGVLDDILEPQASPMFEVNMEYVDDVEANEDMGGKNSEEGDHNEASVSMQHAYLVKGSNEESALSLVEERPPNPLTLVEHNMISNEVDQGPLIPPHVDPEVEKELRFLTLSTDCMAILGPFLTANPTMRLTKSRLFCRSAYKCLWRFLLLVGSQPLSALLGDKQGDFNDFMDALNHFSFDPAWLDDLMKRVNSPYEDSPPHSLERVILRKNQISAEIENLRLEMESLEEQEAQIRSLLDAPLFRL